VGSTSGAASISILPLRQRTTGAPAPVDRQLACRRNGAGTICRICGGSVDEVLNPDRPGWLTGSMAVCAGRGGSRVNERGLAAADRVVRLLRELGIERVHGARRRGGCGPSGDGRVSCAGHARGQRVLPAASARCVAEAGGAATDHPQRCGALTAQATFVLAADPGATAVVLRGYVSAHWTDTVADRADEIAAALLTHLAEADRRAPLPTLRLAGEGEIAGINYQAPG
jgi:hypothetical protein